MFLSQYVKARIKVRVGNSVPSCAGPRDALSISRPCRSDLRPWFAYFRRKGFADPFGKLPLPNQRSLEEESM